MSRFQPGQKVRRKGHNWKNVVRDGIYTVRHATDASVFLHEEGNLNYGYAACNFEAVKKVADPVEAAKKLLEAEGYEVRAKTRSLRVAGAVVTSNPHRVTVEYNSFTREQWAEIVKFAGDK